MAGGPLVRTRSGDVPGMSRRRGQQPLSGGGTRGNRVVGFIVGVMMIYVMGRMIYQSHFVGMFVPDVDVDESGRTRVRRRPDRHKQKMDPNKPTYVFTIFWVPFILRS